MMKKLSLILTILVLFSCKDSKKDIYSTKKISSEKKSIHPGEKLMKMYCLSCHSVSASENNRAAPPMIAVKKRYLMVHTTKEDFVKSMIDWSKNPTKETAIMFGAVKKFGVMPQLMYPEETINKIAEYMFENELEKPEWFDEHHKNNKGSHEINSNKLSYADKGLEYAMTTQSVLGKNLMYKIQKEGTVAAIEFCNTKAYPLTDSLSVVYNANIKRVSDKPRNPSNKATKKEKEYINGYNEDVRKNIESNPIVAEESEKIKFYYPIKMNQKCLQCHGEPLAEINKNTLSQLNKLYPEDLAVGYKPNEVRGLWSITFEK